MANLNISVAFQSELRLSVCSVHSSCTATRRRQNTIGGAQDTRNNEPRVHVYYQQTFETTYER